MGADVFRDPGTYRKNDSVDVQYPSPSGEIRLVTGLDIELRADVGS